MDTETDFAFCTEILIKPIGSQPPLVALSIDQQIVVDLPLENEQRLLFSGRLAKGSHRLCLRFHSKRPDDAEQAVQIKELRMNGIADPKFIWQGIYRPIYPEPWATQQRQAGNDLAETISNTDYMGWNGSWILEFTSPIFTWIHQTQDLGWIYD